MGRPLSVLLDARMAFHSGIGRYVRDLCGELAKRPDEVTLSLLVDPASGPRLREETGVKDTVPYPARIYTAREQLVGSWLCHRRRRRHALIHVPHYNAPWSLPSNSVVTVHDLIHLEQPEHFGRARSRMAELVLRRAVSRAGAVIAVSRATRESLIRRLPASGAKLTTIHPGVGRAFRPLPGEEVERLRSGDGIRNRLLFVGRPAAHKNVGRLIEAFLTVRRRLPGTELVLVGTGLRPLGAIDGVRALGAIDDAALCRWYNLADALVMPSLREGFGLPALEAMACGTPVLVADRPAPAEVVDGAGLAVDPTSTGAIAAGMLRLLRDRRLRETLSARGLERVARFSLNKVARETIGVYRRVTRC